MPTCPFARYGDEGVVQCRTERQAQEVKQRLTDRVREGGLERHPDKTRSVYGKDSNRGGDYPTIQFTFLGFTFRPRRAQNREGALCTSFLPGASREAQTRLRQQIAQWHLPRQTPESLRTLATHYNAMVAGWWQYYGSFSPTEVWKVFRHFDLTLAGWARRKYKTLRGHKRRSRRWLAKVSRRSRSCLFTGGCGMARLGKGSRVSREAHARFCERLRGQFPWPTHQLKN